MQTLFSPPSSYPNEVISPIPELHALHANSDVAATAPPKSPPTRPAGNAELLRRRNLRHSASNSRNVPVHRNNPTPRHRSAHARTTKSASPSFVWQEVDERVSTCKSELAPSVASRQRVAPLWKVTLVVVLVVQMGASLFLLLRSREDEINGIHRRNDERLEGIMGQYAAATEQTLVRLVDQLDQWKLAVPFKETAEDFDEFFNRDLLSGRLLWMKRVLHADRAEFEQSAHAELSAFLNTTLIPRNITAIVTNNDSLIVGTEVSPPQPEYLVEMYAAPRFQPGAVYMWDMLSEPTRSEGLRETIDAAGTVTASNRLLAPFDGVLQAVTGVGTAVPDPANSSEVLGVLVSSMHWQTLLPPVLSLAPSRPVQLRVYDVTLDREDQTGCLIPMTFGGVHGADGSWTLVSEEELIACPGVSDPADLVPSGARSAVVSNGLRQFLLVVSKDASFDEEFDTAEFVFSSAYLAVAVLMMVMVLVAVWMFARHMQRADEATGEYIEQLIRAEKQAREAKEHRDQFLAFLSHELRNPLFGLQGSVDEGKEHMAACEDSVAQEHMSGVLSTMEYCATQIERTLNTVVNVQNMANGRIVLDEQPFRVADLVGKLQARYQQRADEAGVSLFVDVDESVPDVLVGDRSRLLEVAAHLVKNAIEHSPVRSCVSFHVSASSGSLPDRSGGGFSPAQVVPLGHERSMSRTLHSSRKGDIYVVEFEVVDQGPGMSQLQIERAFQPYTRERIARASHGHGSSLGLPTAKLLCQQMDGGVEIESTRGKGCKVTATVRLGRALHDVVEELGVTIEGNVAFGARSQALLPAAHGALSLPIELQSFDGRFLVVDDQRINRRVVSRILSKLAPSASVDVAEDGRDALQKVQQAASELTAYDVVFMDIQMPHMTGIEATRQLRQEGFSMPIVAVTGGTLEEEVATYLAAGMDDVIHKPCKKADFERAIRAQLG